MIHTFSDWISQPVRGVEALPQHSNTVPDMSLSVKDILQRFRRGTLDPESVMRRYPDTEDDIDDDILDSVEDISDVLNLKQELNGKVSEILRFSVGTPGGDSPGTQDAPGKESSPEGDSK